MIDSGYLRLERRGWRERCRESRRCSRDTYPESYITKYASIRRKIIMICFKIVINRVKIMINCYLATKLPHRWIILVKIFELILKIFELFILVKIFELIILVKIFELIEIVELILYQSRKVK